MNAVAPDNNEKSTRGGHKRSLSKYVKIHLGTMEFKGQSNAEGDNINFLNAVLLT